MTILQRDDWDRYVLLKENDMNKQMIQIEEELYKSVYLSECLFDKDVYDKLEHMPIDDYFHSSNDKFDLIVALEVTGYLDSLSELFEGVKTHLHSDGQFIFSIEYPLDKNETQLSINGRYLYSIEFTKQALEKAGLTVAETKEINLRREGNDYAKGAVLIATPS
jgi:predicted TPR repeat methyltransferase